MLALPEDGGGEAAAERCVSIKGHRQALEAARAEILELVSRAWTGDWVLLKDAVRTIAKSILTIRRHGLRHRMPSPESFLRTVNKIAMQMHHARRKSGAKKARKRLFRQLKKVARTVANHADATWHC